MSELNTQTIKKRAVFFIGGFDPKSPDAFFGKQNREIKRYEELWDTNVNFSSPENIDADVSLTRYTCRSNSDSWPIPVETDFHFLSLDDIVLKDFARPLHIRLGKYVKSWASYVFSGTAFNFIRHAWRFALYFAYPAIMFFFAVVMSFLIANFAASAPFPFAWLAANIVFIASFILMVKFGGNRYHVLHLMDLWSFSYDFIQQNRADITNKLDRLAGTIASQLTQITYDEVLFVGHSTGGALILDAVSLAVEKHPKFLTKYNSVNVLTLGSTTLKIGLHPKAGWFRQRINQLFANPKINWVEYQCLTDVINFHRTDPAELMDIQATPIIRNIKIREMLDAKTYARIKRNFFRVHYQFVFGNTKPYHFDFLSICFGPTDLLSRATSPHLYMANTNHNSNNGKNEI